MGGFFEHFDSGSLQASVEINLDGERKDFEGRKINISSQIFENCCQSKNIGKKK
jgi:hypothetical protein